MSTRTEALQRAEPLTLDRWRKLPWLLPRAVVLEWTGLSVRELKEHVRSGQLRPFLAGRRKSKYYKAEVEALARIAPQPTR